MALSPRVVLLHALFLCFARCAHAQDVYAAIGVVGTLSPGLAPAIGTVQKHPGFLFNQTEPWEHDVNNGYPNVVYSPGDPHGTYRIWYNSILGRASPTYAGQAVLYANSSDGIVWDKPKLGLIDLDKLPGLLGTNPELKGIGRANNVVMAGGGVGVFKDPSPAGGFKAFGHLQLNLSEYVSGWGTDVTAESADGLHWTAKQAVVWPPPHRHDCHNNIFYDPMIPKGPGGWRAAAGGAGRYVATTRDVHPTSCDKQWASNCQRNIGMTASLLGQGFMFDGTAAPTMVETGEVAHQLYSQVSFRWHSIYMGIVMVYDATDPINRVHCRLVWAHPSEALTPATAGNASASGWRWVDPGGITGADFIPLNSTVPPGGNAFDSHLCYAAPPVHTPAGERLYYMGSNGPHSGSHPPRNASLGLAYLRTDGFAGIAGSGTLTTVPLVVGGKTLTLTLDVMRVGGSVAVGAYAGGSTTPLTGLSLADCAKVSSNVTNGKVIFHAGANFARQLGQNVTLKLEITAAIVYTIGWID